jgi:chromosome segregation ATPase
LAELKQQLMQTAAEARQLEAECGSYRAEGLRQQDSIAEYERELQCLRASLSATPTEHDRWTELQVLSAERNELRQELADQEERYQQLKARHRDAESAQEQLEDAYKRECSEHQQLKQENQRYKEELKKVSKEKVAAENEASRYRCSFQ